MTQLARIKVAGRAAIVAAVLPSSILPGALPKLRPTKKRRRPNPSPRRRSYLNTSAARFFRSVLKTESTTISM